VRGDARDLHVSTDAIAWSSRLAAPSRRPRLLDVHIRQEAIMPVTVEERRTKDPGRLIDLAEDAAFIVTLFSGLVLVVALIVAAIVI
jgi:hypothetical protein